LAGWDFSGQDLSNAAFSDANLTAADFTSALVGSANFAIFSSNKNHILTKEQLYSTASYEQKKLQGINLQGNDLTGWDFSGQDLRSAFLNSATLTTADFTGALVGGANFAFNTSRGFTKEQLYSTASYQQKNLLGIVLRGDDLSGWDFSGQNLSDADFGNSTLTNANFFNALVGAADFTSSTSRGFTKEQLYSTASYQQKNLQGIGLRGNDLTGWDFSGQDLTNAQLGTNLSGADLTGADIRGAMTGNLSVAITQNLIHADGTLQSLDLSGGRSLSVRDYDGMDGSGQSPIPIRIMSHLTMSASSSLRLIFDADAWDSLISFSPGVPVQLGGTLELTFANGVDVSAQVGRRLRVFDWSGVNPGGQFQLSSPYDWDLTNLYTIGEVTLLAVPEPSAFKLGLLAISALAVSYVRLRRVRMRTAAEA
jgi:uncharacterized protein YjbI with pentapeptide repeats